SGTRAPPRQGAAGARGRPGGPRADLADPGPGRGHGRAADPVDGAAGLPAAAAAQPALVGAVRRVHAGQLLRRLLLPGVLEHAGHDAGLLRLRHGRRDRARAGGGAGPAPAVPGAQPRAGGDAAALRRAGRRRHLRLDGDAQPAVRRGERVGDAAARLGPADRVPLHAARRAADDHRVRGVAVVPVRVPVPHRPAAGGAGQPGGGRSGGRGDGVAAVPLHHPAAAAAHDRGAGRAALHLDVQHLRRDLPADRRRRRHRGRQRRGVQLPHRARRHRRGRGAVPGPRRDPGGVRGPVPVEARAERGADV
ncbi:MAG: Inner membrane ABC transporter permease protein YcjO, partial [uncultured Pseudonocardia sp.]